MSNGNWVGAAFEIGLVVFVAAAILRQWVNANRRIKAAYAVRQMKAATAQLTERGIDPNRAEDDDGLTTQRLPSRAEVQERHAAERRQLLADAANEADPYSWDPGPAHGHRNAIHPPFSPTTDRLENEL